MQNNTIFVFDLDGTLMPQSNNLIDIEGVSALSVASLYGDIILASARPLKGMMNLINQSKVNTNISGLF